MGPEHMPATCGSKTDRPTLEATSPSATEDKRLENLPDSRKLSLDLRLETEVAFSSDSSHQKAPPTDLFAESSLNELVDKHNEDAFNLTFNTEVLDDPTAWGATMASRAADDLHDIDLCVEGNNGCTGSYEADNQHYRHRDGLYVCSQCSSEHDCSNCRYCGIGFCRNCKRNHCCIDVDGAFDQFISHYFTFSTHADICAAMYTCRHALDAVINNFNQIDSARGINRRRIVQS